MAAEKVTDGSESRPYLVHKAKNADGANPTQGCPINTH